RRVAGRVRGVASAFRYRDKHRRAGTCGGSRLGGGSSARKIVGGVVGHAGDQEVSEKYRDDSRDEPHDPEGQLWRSWFLESQSILTHWAKAKSMVKIKTIISARGASMMY